MAYVREDLNAHIQDNINSAVVNSFTTFSPIWAFLGAAGTYNRKNPYKEKPAGRPTPAKFFGSGMGMTTAQKRSVLGTKEHQIRFVKSEPDDGGSVAYGGNYPTASAYAEDNFGTAEFRWGHYVEPIQIRKDFLTMARGETAVRKAADDSTKPVLERMFKRVTTDFWTGTLTSSEQNQPIWGGATLSDSGVLGLQHQVGQNNVFGRVDRSVETSLNSGVFAAGTEIGTTSTAELQLVRNVQHGFTRTDNSAKVDGITTRTPNGKGVDAVITTSEIWQSLANEADGRYEIQVGGIPGTGLAGFKNPVIAYDNCYITYDNFCPDGEMYLLCMEAWTLEVQQGKDFFFDGLKDNTQLQRGGPAVEWGNFEFMPRLICHAPHLQTKITGLTSN